MPQDSVLDVEILESVAWVWMCRPHVNNALDEALISTLTSAINRLDGDSAVRVIVLGGRGQAFSAGADLNWMRRQGTLAFEDNLADAKRLMTLFRTLAECTKPTIARVHGYAIGGGLGLACAADICIATAAAKFCTSEVRLGLVPSVISPYVIRAIGSRQAYRYFQTAERISAARGREIGLVHELVDNEDIDKAIRDICQSLIAGGPIALSVAKELIHDVAHRSVDSELGEETALRIAQLRCTREAREGMNAFLERRRADWLRDLS